MLVKRLCGVTLVDNEDFVKVRRVRTKLYSHFKCMTFLYSLEFLFCEIDVYFLCYCNWQKTLLNLNFVEENDDDCYPQFATAKYVSDLLIWLGGGGGKGRVYAFMFCTINFF